MTSADVGLLAPVWAGTAVQEATGDAAFLQAMLDAEAALARAQAALGQAPDSAAAAITAAARVERFDLRGIAVRARDSGNPVIPLVADLTSAVPADAAAFVHRGATSQDIVDTALMLIAADAVATLLADLCRTADALTALAAAHRDTPMAARTLTQHAVPTTFGLKAAGWRTLVLDSMDRLTALHLPAQLGGAAGTLAAFETLADAWRGATEVPAAIEQAGESASAGTDSFASAGVPGSADHPLEFSASPSASDSFVSAAAAGGAAGLPESFASADLPGSADRLPAFSALPSGPDCSASAGVSVGAGQLPESSASADAAGSALQLPEVFAREVGLAVPDLPWHVLRTPIADLAGALAFTVGALAKLAADVLVLSRTEIGEVAEGAAGGSSAMPHKANPVRAALIAAAARQAPGLAGVLVGGLGAEDERPAGAWHAEWQPLRELLRLAGGAAEAAAGLVVGLRVFPERMLGNLHCTGGLVVSERLAAELSGLIGRDPARQVLAEAAGQIGGGNGDGGSDGVRLEDVLAEAPELKDLISRDRLRQLADPAGYLGAAGALVDRALRRMPPPVTLRKSSP